MSALAWATVDAREANARDLKAAALHAADMNRLGTHLRKKGYKSAIDVKMTVARALRHACKIQSGPVSVAELSRISSKFLERPRCERMTRRDAADLVAAGLASHEHGRVEFIGCSKKHFAKFRTIYSVSMHSDKNVRPQMPRNKREWQNLRIENEKTMVEYLPPPRQVRFRQPAASLDGVDLDALDDELALLSPSLTATACKEKEKIYRPSPAKPVTKAPDETGEHWSCTLLGGHAVRIAGRAWRRQQRRTIRRNASCQQVQSGRVQHAMEQEWTTPTSPKNVGLTGKNFSSKALITPSPTATETSTDLRFPASNAGRTQTAASATSTAELVKEDTKTPNAPAATIGDDGLISDDDLLSPETLAAIPKLPFFLREQHRRTGRLMALKRLREGLPAWESPEEASAPDGQPERLPEADARGFRKANTPKREDRLTDGIAPLDLTAPPEDHLPADAMWLRRHLSNSPEIRRLMFRAEARGQYTRAQWRAAVGKLISRQKFQIAAPTAYLVQAVQHISKPGAHDNRKSKFYTVAQGWSPELAKFALVESRQAGWLRAYGGRDDWY